jgi:hypothetical protein
MSGTSESLTPLIPATPAPVEPVVPSPIQPAGAPKLPGDTVLRTFFEYDSARIREERSGAIPALVESLRYVSRHSYLTEEMWLEDGKIHPLVKCDGLRVPAQPPPPLTAEEESYFLKMRDYRRRLYMPYFWSLNGFIPQFTRSSFVRTGISFQYA